MGFSTPIRKNPTALERNSNFTEGRMAMLSLEFCTK